MSTRPKRRAGFSLIELIVALAIGSVVLSAMMIVTTFAATRQMSILRDVTMVGQGVSTLETLRSSLRTASYIVTPSSNTQSDVVSGYTNADQSAAFAPILAGRPREYFYFCMVAGPPRRFYRYTESLGIPPALMPAINCGQDGGEMLAGDPQNRLVPFFRFSREQDSSNIITVNYSLSYSSSNSSSWQTIQGKTSMQTQAPLL